MKTKDTEQPTAKNLLLLDQQMCFALYSANLALNTAWSGVFFRAHALVPSTVVAGVLALSSADLTRRAAKTGWGKAAALGVYTAWCGFATVLSGAVARRNRKR